MRAAAPALLVLAVLLAAHVSLLPRAGGAPLSTAGGSVEFGNYLEGCVFDPQGMWCESLREQKVT